MLLLPGASSRRRATNTSGGVHLEAPVQIAGGVEMSSINTDALFIEHDGIPDVERSGILEPESTEVELTLANAMHQLDA